MASESPLARGPARVCCARMRIRAALVVLAVAAPAGASPMLVSSTTPHTGIEHDVWADSSVPWTAHLIKLDLTNAEIGVYATPPDDAGETTTAFSKKLSAQVAINGDSFAASGYVPLGLAMGGSMPWTNTSDDNVTAVLHFQRLGERTSATIEPPEAITTFASLPTGVEGVISGRPLLVRAGAATAQFDCTDPVAIPCERAPRTAVALSADGNTMWLVVVDGYATASLGMLDSELASFLVARGAATAIALDPGSSSTMVVDGALASVPSDGVERTVANHLAVKWGSLPTGTLVGFTCKDAVFTCGDHPDQQLSGVKITLDDGRTQTTGTPAFYQFANVTQRLACVTAKLSGYLTVRQCAQMMGSGTTYNSIQMFKGTDTLDAGIRDGGMGNDDVDAGIGSGGGDDAGNAETGPGRGGCCDAGGRSHLPADVLVIVLVTWFLTRRRGTTV
jgi:hypothetical protein